MKIWQGDTVKDVEKLDADVIWSTGITIHYGYAGSDRHGWGAKCTFDQGTPCKLGYINGTIKTRYYEKTLAQAIQCVRDMANRLGVIFVSSIFDAPMIDYEGDGESTNYPPPENWRAMLQEEAKRIGWVTYK